jgi:predicted nucleic acid-binding protein
MIVVSDTSPVHYLVLAGVEHILPQLFGEVVIPPTVLAELQRHQTPEPVRQ